MKVLQISTGYDISFNGGITNYVRNISETLAEYGNEVYVLYSQDNGQEKHYNYQLISYQPFLRPFHLDSVLENEDIDKVEAIVKELKPDIIHIHMMIDLPLLIIEMFKKYAKVVISLHDYSYICNRIILIDNNGNLCENNQENDKCNSCISYEETLDNRIIRGGIQRVKSIFKIKKLLNSNGHHSRFVKGQEIFKKVDALIAVSNRVREIYIQNGYTNDRFYVNHIGNYTAEESFRSCFEQRKPMKNEQKLKFSFIGNLNYHKGANIFIKLAQNCKHQFHIYGGIEESILEQVNTFENVTYHGKYNHNDLKGILQNVDFGLVLPIWEDNAPQVVFEFLNSGVPIIATKMGGIPDFVNDSNGILFKPNNQGINDIIDFINSDEIYRFYNNTINTIKGTKTAKAHMDELIEIYNTL